MRRKRAWASESTEEELDLDLNQDEEFDEITDDEEIVLDDSELFTDHLDEEIELILEEDESTDDAEDDYAGEDVHTDHDDSGDDQEGQEMQEAEVTLETDELEELDFNLDEVVPSISKAVNRIPEAGVLTVVNSVKNGNRVAISREVHLKLGEPTALQVGFRQDCLILGQHLGDTYTTYTLKQQGAKQIIYSKELVKHITAHFQLDFSNRTSVTFHTVTYKKRDDQVIAIIKL